MADLRRAKVRVWEEGEQLRYQAPRGALTPDLWAELQNSKPELIEFCRQAKAGISLLPLEPSPRDVDVPISLGQQRLWVLDQLEGPSPTYNIALALRLRGPLNVDAIQRSLTEVMRRHETLRTSFQARGETVRQVIVPAPALPFSVVDLRHLDASRRLSEARRQAGEEALRPFDLSRGPLVRFVLWRLDDREHVLLTKMHHIISDGRSIEVLTGEMAALYASYCAGTTASLPELRIQYGDFAWHQRRWLTDAVLKKQLDYWTQRLAGMPPLLELPTDRPRPPAFTSAGATLRSRLKAGLVDSLRQVARRSSATLYMSLLAGVAAVLARYTGREDIAIGCPVTHRDRPELELLIGFFVNTLVLRLDLSGNPSFRALLARTRAVVTDGFANQDVPFDKVVETVISERNPSYPPLVQFSMMMLDSERSRPHLPGIESDAFDFGHSVARYDVTLEIYESNGIVDIFWIYNTELFEADTIARMARHLENLLRAVADNPEKGMAELPMLDELEVRNLLHTWNDTRVDAPQHQRVHRLFERQAERTPDAPALEWEGTHLTYAELNSRSNQLAHHLAGLGVGPDVLVGICVERSFEMVVSLLAVLKAGGAYVPFDPDIPAGRLAYMLDDARIEVLLTQNHLRDRFRGRDARVVCLDAVADQAAIDGQREDAPALIAGDAHLAYVIYTSGSTGKPKGVMVSQRNLVHSTHARLVYYDEPLSGFLLLSSFAFDSSVAGIFGTLCRGGMIVLPPPGAQHDPIFLAGLIAESRLSHLLCVPSLYDALLAEAPAGSLDELRVAIVAGEPCRRELVERHRAVVPQAALVNEYGPTEATVWCCAHRCRTGEERAAVPIGRPVANTRIYLLDARLEPVPIGVAGELYVGGPGVARGYLHRSALTAERFVPDPFGDEPGARLYRTGDRAHWRPDAVLEFLGRADDQVKVRGHRIELGEVEAILGQHPAVAQSVVLARDDGSRGKRLVAYVVGAPAPSPSDLRAFLGEKMPDYMVPSAFVFLDALPITANGKVDRGALPHPDPGRPASASDMVLPRTPAERLLADIWARLLGLERVGIHDNFFELGGDSILSIQVVGRANQSGLRLTPRQLFQHQTIAGLAAVAEMARPIQAEQTLVTGPVPLSPVQHWFFEQNLPDAHHFNQALLLEVRTPLDPALLEQAVQHLALHHDALRMSYRLGESGWQQVIGGPNQAVHFSRIDLSTLTEADLEPAIEARAADLQTRLDLNNCLMRVAHFDLGPRQPARLLWVIHHLVVDGVSWRILLEDLLTAYQQLDGGRPIQLPPKTASFQCWVSRLVDYARGAALQREHDFWLDESRSRVTRLPVDHVDGVNTRASVRQVRVALDTDQTSALLREVSSVYRTQVNDVLLTALLQAFSRWTGSDSLLVDLEGHGREPIFEDIDLSRTVGWFTSIVPVALNLEESRHPGRVLQSVKEQLRRIPEGGLGHGVLRYLTEDADISQRLRALPQAVVCFNYLGQFDRVLPESAPLAPAQESTGPYASPKGRRKHLLEIDGEVAAGRLQFRWRYSGNMHRPETIESLARGFVQALIELIAHCQTPEAGGVTPSDFPLAGLNQQQLDKLAKMIG